MALPVRNPQPKDHKTTVDYHRETSTQMHGLSLNSRSRCAEITIYMFNLFPPADEFLRNSSNDF